MQYIPFLTLHRTLFVCTCIIHYECISVFPLSICVCNVPLSALCYINTVNNNNKYQHYNNNNNKYQHFQRGSDHTTTRA